MHLMGRVEEITLTSYEHVRCSPELITTTTIKPVTIVPPTTTTSTSEAHQHGDNLKRIQVDLKRKSVET